MDAHPGPPVGHSLIPRHGSIWNESQGLTAEEQVWGPCQFSPLAIAGAFIHLLIQQIFIGTPVHPLDCFQEPRML